MSVDRLHILTKSLTVTRLVTGGHHNPFPADIPVRDVGHCREYVQSLCEPSVPKRMTPHLSVFRPLKTWEGVVSVELWR